MSFQLTCPMRGTTAAVQADVDFIGISTHVPHAGHDPSARYPLLSCADFNSRAPCGARPCCGTTAFPRHLFQLTCPMRGTTRRLLKFLPVREISTHVPHAGHDNLGAYDTYIPNDFNSRAPCGARHAEYTAFFSAIAFQLTCPMRGTTRSILYVGC